MSQAPLSPASHLLAYTDCRAAFRCYENLFNNSCCRAPERHELLRLNPFGKFRQIIRTCTADPNELWVDLCGMYDPRLEHSKHERAEHQKNSQQGSSAVRGSNCDDDQAQQCR